MGLSATTGDREDFVACYNPKNRHERRETERFKSFTYEELIKRDKHSLPDSNVLGFPRHAQSLDASRRKAGCPASANLDIWLKDESLEDSANLPDPDVLAAEIVEDLEAALQQFAAIATDLKR